MKTKKRGMNRTPIEWVKNPDGTQGFSSNPIKGICKGGCSYCYAKRNYRRFKWDPKIRFDHKEAFRPFERKKPAGIFLCSTHELFGDWIPKYWRDVLLNLIKECPQHKFYMLTKHPENIPWPEMPDNVWLGVTITGQESDEEQLKLLEQLVSVRATLHFVSFEPLLGPITCEVLDMIESFDIVKWVIVGAQTKPIRLPELEWINEIIDCVWYGAMGSATLFMKNNLRKMAPAIKEFQEWELGDGMIQEFPK